MVLLWLKNLPHTKNLPHSPHSVHIPHLSFSHCVFPKSSERVSECPPACMQGWLQSVHTSHISETSRHVPVKPQWNHEGYTSLLTHASLLRGWPQTNNNYFISMEVKSQHLCRASWLGDKTWRVIANTSATRPRSFCCRHQSDMILQDNDYGYKKWCDIARQGLWGTECPVILADNDCIVTWGPQLILF